MGFVVFRGWPLFVRPAKCVHRPLFCRLRIRHGLLIGHIVSNPDQHIHRHWYKLKHLHIQRVLHVIR
jgi:hypothetical protein